MERNGLDRDRIKLMAIIAMALNHIAIVFELPFALEFVFTSIGYCTLPIMSYFLVEGYFFTKSRRNYFLRLVLFGFISQIPYILAINPENNLLPLNIFFTLSVCFLIVDIYYRRLNAFLKIVIVLLLFYLSGFMDWAYFAPLYTLVFCFCDKNRNNLKYGFAIMTMFISIYQGTAMLQNGRTPFSSFFCGVAFFIGSLLSSYLILYSYNGKKSTLNKKVTKWLFYLFYPTHLLILSSISFCLANF